MSNQNVAAQIADAAERYSEIKRYTEEEIAKIKQQLLETGVSGSTIVKLKPIWHNDVDYLLKKETAAVKV